MAFLSGLQQAIDNGSVAVAHNPWLAMMNSTGLGQQQAALAAAQQQTDALTDQVRRTQQYANVKREALNWKQSSNAAVISSNLYAQMQNVALLAVPPPKHTAKELTAFALAWVFGDEEMAPLLAYDAPGTAGDLRAPSTLDFLRSYEVSQAEWWRCWAREQTTKPWFWPVIALASFVDVFSWLHH